MMPKEEREDFIRAKRLQGWWYFLGFGVTLIFFVLWGLFQRQQAKHATKKAVGTHP